MITRWILNWNYTIYSFTPTVIIYIFMSVFTAVNFYVCFILFRVAKYGKGRESA